MRRLLPFGLLLLAVSGLCSCGKSLVERELDKFKAEGKPTSLADLGLSKGYESADWNDVSSLVKELKEDSSYREFQDFHRIIHFTGPGICGNPTTQSSVIYGPKQQDLTWDEIDNRTRNMRIILSKLPVSDRKKGLLFIPDYTAGAATKVPHVGFCLDLVKARNQLILVDAALERPDAALDNIESGRLTISSMLGNNSLIEGLVNITSNELLMRASWSLLQHESMDKERLVRLQQIWENTFQPSDALHTIQGERITMGRSILPFRNPQSLIKTEDGVAGEPDVQQKIPFTLEIGRAHV